VAHEVDEKGQHLRFDPHRAFASRQFEAAGIEPESTETPNHGQDYYKMIRISA
jgi:hypothetical protein